MLAEEDMPGKKRNYEIGQPLDTMSLEDLAEMIAVLEGEIARIEAARKAKSAHLSAAEALFSRKA